MSYIKFVSIEKSTNKNKKWKATFLNMLSNKLYSEHFGHSEFLDFTQHGDIKRRENYIKRHKGLIEANNITNVTSPAYLSLYILWGNSTDINKNISEYLNKFKIEQ
jgi:hypothetical protein